MMQKIGIKLAQIQGELKAPKAQYNSFGKYNYRSCEDILNAAKPLLAAKNCVLFITDEVKEVGGRVYVDATATVVDIESGEALAASAFAREPESKKGMDESQITGATSSYARKYALNGLFCIDDVKDADATNTHGKEGSSQYSCEVCHKAFQPTAANGKTYTAKDIYDKAKAMSPDGVVRCSACLKKVQDESQD